MKLTATEADILSLLEPETYTDPDLISRCLWGYSDRSAKATVRAHIYNMRAKGLQVETRYGRGWRLGMRLCEVPPDGPTMSPIEIAAWVELLMEGSIWADGYQQRLTNRVADLRGRLRAERGMAG